MGDVRHGEIARLRAALDQREPGLRIVGVSGPGGVGKSYLVRAVVEALEAEGVAWLRLSVDGANEQARGDLFALVEGQLARTGPAVPGRARRDPFPEIRKVASMHRALVEAVAVELDAGTAPAEVKVAALELLRMGRRLNKVLPKSKQLFDAAATEDGSVGPSLDEAWRLVTNLRALRTSSWLPTPVRDLLGSGTKERIRTDLYNLTAEALVDDVAAELASSSALPRRRPGGSRAATRVLIVVDDFEALAPVLEEFLVGAVVPAFAEAPFPTALVVVGRDALEAMHPSWSQHARPYLAPPIALAPLDRDASLALLASAGVPEDRRASMFDATQGFPFLLALLVDEARSGADSALFLRQFFDRTTRWLDERQREWFTRVVYLEAVNVDTLAPLFPGEDVERIQDWFEREASLRDPSANVFRVRPLIRDKVLRYLELRAPSRHREMLDKAR